MSNRWVIGGAIAILAMLVTAGIFAVLKIDIAPEAKPGKRPVRKQNLGEGIRISKHGLYGVDLVSIGKAHMRKLRKGPFTIGAINELVLEDVSLALPEELWDAEKVKVKGEGGQRTDKNSSVQPPTSNLQPDSSAKATLAKIGITPGHIKMGGKIPRFSALVIRNLRVSRIMDGTNAVPWFAASNAKAEREGLALKSGWSVENGVTNSWKEGFLAVDPALKLFYK